MDAFWSGSVATFLDTSPAAIVGQLAETQIRHFRISEAQQLRAWGEEIALLRDALPAIPASATWHLLLEYPLMRLGRRADAILLTPHAIIVLEFKVGAGLATSADQAQAEDYALDLQDFHAGCRHHPIVPVVVATEATPRPASLPLLLGGTVAPVQTTNSASLAKLLTQIASACPRQVPKLDAAAWRAAPYRPVPTIIEAARMLYARNAVAEIASARADATNLSLTSDAILRAVAEARRERARIVVFVTGIPGAGKTLCGLNTCFSGGEDSHVAFLTGNPTLVHVLREALARDAADQGMNKRAAQQRMESTIQALPYFRDHYIKHAEPPAESVIVIDEAQRCWSREQAVRKSRDRAVRLDDSEPGLLLDIMARHTNGAVIVCLVGGGQEIHDGEGGLAGWGEALAQRPGWRVLAAPDTLTAADPRQRLPALHGMRVDPSLHLAVPVRAIRNACGPAWVDAVLAGDAERARAIARAAGGAPFLLTRSLAELRSGLRMLCRGQRRAGLLASSGGKRLRAVGLGVELPHMEPVAVAQWFLDRWPDVRASDALEMVATEFSCQGLELDYAGLCWDADLIHDPVAGGWIARAFRGSRWIRLRSGEAVANQINTYRVLMTRARYETILFVPCGNPEDQTRPPAIYDQIAEFLLACGAEWLPLEQPVTEPAPHPAEFALI